MGQLQLVGVSTGVYLCPCCCRYIECPSVVHITLNSASTTKYDFVDTLIIDHGMSYYSLYGHCADFLVNKGDPVKGEQPIAMVGDIGSLKGATLYFEIRYKTKPLNPLQWLKRR